MSSIAAKRGNGKIIFILLLILLGVYLASGVKIHVGDWRDPEKICRTCSGTGYIKGKPCFVCKGTGLAR